jgi:hypothetical protein
MKSLIELYKESADTKLEINVLISESNNPVNTIDLRLSLLAQITSLHNKLNNTMQEIRRRRSQPCIS